MPDTLPRGKVITIVGPTAVGKSALAVSLAKKLGGEVVSADSRQVYRGLDIGTGKVTAREMRGIPHHLLDVASPRNQYSVARYVQKGQQALADIIGRGKLPIVVGGTGLYIDALLGSVQFPDVPPNPKLRKALAKKSVVELFALLQKLDPQRAQTIDRHNFRRLARAMEIAKSLGRVPARHSYIPMNAGITKIEYEPFFIGLTLPKEELQRRIRRRLHARLKSGMISEVRKLNKSGVSFRRLDALGLEYRHVSRHLRGLITKEEMIQKLETEIWHYAKRQLVWFRRNKKISWFTPNQTPQIVQTIQKFLH